MNVEAIVAQLPAHLQLEVHLELNKKLVLQVFRFDAAGCFTVARPCAHCATRTIPLFREYLERVEWSDFFLRTPDMLPGRNRADVRRFFDGCEVADDRRETSGAVRLRRYDDAHLEECA